jgi:hypothetical protein
MIQIFDLLDTAPALVWLAAFGVVAVLAGWLWFGWRVVLLSAALIGGGLLAGLAVALAVDAAFAFVAAHTSLSLGLFLGFCLGFAVGLVALVLWGVFGVSGKTADPGN